MNESIVPEGSEALDAIFKECSAPVSSVSGEEPKDSTLHKDRRHEFLLTKEAVPAIINLFELKESTNADLCRAIEQARSRIERNRPGSA